MFKQDRGSGVFVLLHFTILTFYLFVFFSFLSVGTQEKGRQQCKQLKSQLASARIGGDSYSQENVCFCFSVLL